MTITDFKGGVDFSNQRRIATDGAALLNALKRLTAYTGKWLTIHYHCVGAVQFPDILELPVHDVQVQIHKGRAGRLLRLTWITRMPFITNML